MQIVVMANQDPINHPSSDELAKFRGLHWLFFLAGCLINGLSYESVEPIVASTAVFVVVFGFLTIPWVGGVGERFIFAQVFSVLWFTAGIASIYANWLRDPSQLISDAQSFFEMAAWRASGDTLDEIRETHDGSLAILIWREVYNFFVFFGFSRLRCIGILVNVVFVGLTSVVALRAMRSAFGSDILRLKYLALMFSSCGLLWLFSGIHIRDSAVLFLITVLLYSWILFLKKPDVTVKLAILGVASAAVALLLTTLRNEFLMVPIAMAIAGIASIAVGTKAKGFEIMGYVAVAVGLLGLGLLWSVYGEQTALDVTGGRIGYSNLSDSQHDRSSLGMSLIVRQALPIRLVLGTIYLFLFPIPFWSGFQLQNAYLLFKSCNVLMFYALIPMLCVSAAEIWRDASRRTPQVLFLLFCSIGFSATIAATSLETRHFGAFVVPIFLFALVADFTRKEARVNYRYYLQFMIGGVFAVHLLWALLKLR